MDAAGIAALMAERGRHAEGGGVWPHNVAAVTAFLAVSTQWRTALTAGEHGLRTIFVGLDYAAARAGLDGLGIAVTPELWARLVVIERAARDALNGG
jgi:hypothetical protein